MNLGRVAPIGLILIFLGWMIWLGFAVWQKDRTRVISRAQLAAATHLIIAEIQPDAQGNPGSAVVKQVLRGAEVSGELSILNLAGATPPGMSFPGAGEYLLPLVGDGQTYRIAGLPRSPGMEPQTQVRPAIYIWDAATKSQLQALGMTPPN